MADAWIDHGLHVQSRRHDLLAYAHGYRDQVLADWQQYKAAFQAAQRAQHQKKSKLDFGA